MSMRITPSLFALAVAAVGAPAAAQNVQIYGIADIGVAVTKFNGDTLTAMRENRTARFGFRGSEKLASGVEVLFRLEGEVAMDTGQNPDGLFYRQAWAGVRGAYGTFRLGQTKNLYDDLSEFIDPFRNDGIVGDFSKRAWRVAVAKSRVSNSATYESPSLSGLKLALQYSLDESANNAGTPGKSLAVTYEGGGLMMLGAYDEPTLTAAGPQPVAWMLGAAYQFGPVRLSASYNKGDLKNGTSTVAATDLDSYTVGLAWSVGPGTAKAVYSTMDSSAGNVNASIRDVNVYGLGYDYPMSRRTTLYFIGLLEREGQYNSTTRRFITGDTKGVQVGMTHNF